MSFPRYPEYKDSGIDWLGTVPKHWGTGSMRWLTRRYSGGTPDKNNLEYWEQGTIPWLNSGAVNDRLIKEPSCLISREAFENSSAKWIPAGALVMALAGQGKTKGMVAQLSIPTTCNQSMAAIIPGAELDPRFLYWWLDSNYQNIRNLAGGDLRDGLNLELLGNIQCPLPQAREQEAIAAFLDKETAKIDALISEQEQLIALLKEKRQAAISHAVTKGLNPDAPMKDSGVKWLGQIPAQWSVKRLKFISPFITVGIVVNPSDYVSDEGLPFIYGGNIAEGSIDSESCRRISATDSDRNGKTKLGAGDLLTVRVGAPGITAVVTEECAGGNCASVMLTRKGDFDSDWLCYAMNSRMVRYQVEIVQYGAAQEQFNISHAKEFFVATPSRLEQEQIARYLRMTKAELEELAKQAQLSITLLQERRSALISAAVTGKIDVRGSA